MNVDIYNLFEANSMRELKKISSSLVISHEDLHVLIKLTEQKHLAFPYLHACKWHEEIPDGLELTEKNISAIKNNGIGALNKNAKKAINKLFQMPKQIKRQTAHIFYNKKYWHMFYFDIRDQSKYKNHWKYGSHLHYVSWLWPNLTAQSAWRSFCNDGKKNFGKDLHIKFIKT